MCHADRVDRAAYIDLAIGVDWGPVTIPDGSASDWVTSCPGIEVACGAAESGIC